MGVPIVVCLRLNRAASSCSLLDVTTMSIVELVEDERNGKGREYRLLTLLNPWVHQVRLMLEHHRKHPGMGKSAAKTLKLLKD